MSEPFTSVERARGCKDVVVKRYGTTVLTMLRSEAENLRKQIDEALKDPLEGYGLPWDYAAKTNWLRTIDLAIVAGPGQGTIARAFASLSEAEQREFLMRGLT